MAYEALLILLTLGLVECYYQPTNYYDNRYSTNHMYCDDMSPYYGDINLDQITGVWYGVERIPHNKGEYKIERSSECFYIDIKEVDIMPTPPTPYPDLSNTYALTPRYNQQYRDQYKNRPYGLQEPYRIRYFVLEWHEGLWRDDYHIKVNTSHKGFWPTDVPQRSVEPMYRFFGGVIQVLKVANNHLVLNFCMRLPYPQMYSVVLSRNENQLTPEDLSSIHNVFTLKNLSASALKRVCDNSATKFNTSSFIFIIISFLIWRSHS